MWRCVWGCVYIYMCVGVKMYVHAHAHTFVIEGTLTYAGKEDPAL